MQDFERLGAFYLGKAYDPVAKTEADEAILYDSKDLTTHGVIVGMTGSGKTGLAVALLEEAAIDGVPAIAIDPKGDLANLLLTFPDLAASDFRPWIDEAEAARRGVTPDGLAQETATRWRAGIASYGQTPERIARFRDAVDAVVYTPGSTAGRPLAVLKSFSAPSAAVRDDAEALRARVGSTTSSLLSLLGIDADPMRSREHVLIASLLDHAWREGRDLDVAGLLRAVQSPPFERLGVLDLETFYPAKDRFALAMALNALVAAPGFSAWTEGEPLDVGRLLRTPEGKPRLCVLSIAHLTEAERMFFVTAVLGEVLAWTRAQPGTSSLRALLYMDEVFGYFPPTATPPSKLPMLTLLKQARAYGVGVLLATQNPVDLDYKGLGNAGTWFLGRLQTERDKARVADGLEGASAAAATFDRARLEATLSALPPRAFLMVNAHDDAPTLFKTRWTLSYLAGPLTKPQIRALTEARDAHARASDASPAAASARAAAPYGVRVAPPASPATHPSPAPPPLRAAAANARPVLAPDVPEVFLSVPRSAASAASAGSGSIEYRPVLLASARVHYVAASVGVDSWEDLAVRGDVPSDDASDPWSDATFTVATPPDTEREPVEGASFAPLAASATRARNFATWKKALLERLHRERGLTIWRAPTLREASRPDETEGDFRARIAHLARERRDAAVEALRRKYQSRVTTLGDRIRAAKERVEREKSQASAAKWSTGVSVMTGVFGAIFGRKLGSVGNASRVGTTIRGVGRSRKEEGDVARAEEGVEALTARMRALEEEIAAEVKRIQDAPAGAADVVAERIAPRKSDLGVGSLVLAWIPHRVGPDGFAHPLA